MRLFQWQNDVLLLLKSYPLSLQAKETYRREEWGIGDSKSLADSVFLKFKFPFLIGCCVYRWNLAHKDTAMLSQR